MDQHSIAPSAVGRGCRQSHGMHDMALLEKVRKWAGRFFHFWNACFERAKETVASPSARACPRQLLTPFPKLSKLPKLPKFIISARHGRAPGGGKKDGHLRIPPYRQRDAPTVTERPPP
jgi:hypothetical protein